MVKLELFQYEGEYVVQVADSGISSCMSTLPDCLKEMGLILEDFRTDLMLGEHLDFAAPDPLFRAKV